MSTERTPFVTDEQAFKPGAPLTVAQVRDIYEAELARKDAEIEALRNQWISVKDRLPEEKTLVLAFVNYPDESRYHHVSFYLDGYWSGLQASFVTHWMPLPTPPQP